MVLLSLAIAPGLAICLFIYFKDKYNREPLGYLIRCFLLGMLSAMIALFVEGFGERLLGRIITPGSLLYIIVFSFCVVALAEEGSKFFMLKRYAFSTSKFDEPFDGIVYSVMIGMGFATLENIGYVYEYGMSTALLRMFLSVPAHACFAVLMGYYAGIAKFSRHEVQTGFLSRGLLLAIFFHGMFDCFLFLTDSDEVNKYISDGLLILGAFVSYFIAIRLSLKAIRLQRDLSQQVHEH